jgi:hypothetical protein
VDHGGDLVARAGRGGGQRGEATGELDVVPLEQVPHELFLAHEVAIQRAFGNADPSRDVADRRFGNALFHEQADGGGFNPFACVGKWVSRHE